MKNRGKSPCRFCSGKHADGDHRSEKPAHRPASVSHVPPRERACAAEDPAAKSDEQSRGEAGTGAGAGGRRPSAAVTITLALRSLCCYNF